MTVFPFQLRASNSTWCRTCITATQTLAPPRAVFIPTPLPSPIPSLAAAVSDFRSPGLLDALLSGFYTHPHHPKEGNHGHDHMQVIYHFTYAPVTTKAWWTFSSIVLRAKLPFLFHFDEGAAEELPEPVYPIAGNPACVLPLRAWRPYLCLVYVGPARAQSGTCFPE